MQWSTVGRIQNRGWGYLTVLGAVIVVVGATLVIKGEIDRVNGDSKFRDTQEALKAGIEVVGQTATEDGRTFRPSSPEESTGSQDSGTLTTAELAAIARIQIPSIDADWVALEYRRYSDLELGLGWMPQSVKLGDIGMSIVVGHRTLFGAPLRRLDEVVEGDTILVQLTSGESLAYTIRQSVVKLPSDNFSDLISNDGQRQLLLVTCHPEDSTDFRLLVVADVVEQI